MTASTRLFNDSTFTFGAAIAHVIGIQFKQGGAVVDVSEPEDANKLFELGQPDLELAIKVKRMPTLSLGAKDTPAIVWANGDTSTLSGTWQVTSLDGGGEWDAGIAGSITIKPSVPTGDSAKPKIALDAKMPSAPAVKAAAPAHPGQK